MNIPKRNIFNMVSDEVMEQEASEEEEFDDFDERDAIGMMKKLFVEMRNMKRELKASQKESDTLVSAEMAAIADKVDRQLEQQTAMFEGINGRITSVETKLDKNQEAHTKLMNRMTTVENQIKKGGVTSSLETAKALRNVDERRATTELLFIESILDWAKLQLISTEWDKTTTSADAFWFNMIQNLFPALKGCFTHLRHTSFPLPGKNEATADKLIIFHPSIPAADFFRGEIAKWRVRAKAMMAEIIDEENPRLAVAVIPGAGKDDRSDRQVLEKTLMKMKGEKRITSFLSKPYYCTVTRRYQWTASIRRGKLNIQDIAAKIPSVFTAQNRIGTHTVNQLAEHIRPQLPLLPEYRGGGGGAKRKDSSPIGSTPKQTGKKSNVISDLSPLHPDPTQNMAAALSDAGSQPPTAASG